MKYKYVVLIHRIYSNGNIKKGGLDLIIDYLSSKDGTILMVEFPLDYKQSKQIRISSIKDNKQTILEISRMPIYIPVLVWGLEFLLTLTAIFRYGATGGTVITSDPLTSLPAVLLRKSGMFKFHYYHSVDYSTDRFKNKLLNSVYYKLLKKGLRNADLVGIVTHKAAERLSQFGVKRTVYIPNSMDFRSLDKYRKSIKDRVAHSLVITCSEVSHKYLIQDQVILVEKLKEKYPDIIFNVIGRFDPNDSYFKDLIKYVELHELKDNVIFHGQLDREKNYDLLANSMVGLAFYDGMHSHVLYGDALKIREYSALGVPTVADTHTYTAVEMNENRCGYTVESVNAALDKITDLFEDTALYERCADASLKWAKKNDKRKLLDTLYLNYLK